MTAGVWNGGGAILDGSEKSSADDVAWAIVTANAAEVPNSQGYWTLPIA